MEQVTVGIKNGVPAVRASEGLQETLLFFLFFIFSGSNPSATGCRVCKMYAIRLRLNKKTTKHMGPRGKLLREDDTSCPITNYSSISSQCS